MVGKHRCTNCKDYFPADTMIICNAGKFHSRECLKDYGINHTHKLIEKTKQVETKKDAARKKIFYAGDLKTRKKAAKLACHLYIRTRDKNNLCICCDRSLGKNFDAGHYLESGNNSAIRFDEDNIHAQSVYCNQYKGGNSDDYRGNLIKKIGLQRVERLESMKGGITKRTAEDYKEIELYFKEKLKQLSEQMVKINPTC